MIQITHSFSENALCCKLGEVNPEWFFSEDPDETQKAQSICSQCSVSRECLDWAISIEKDERFNWGVYGGLTSSERKSLL